MSSFFACNGSFIGDDNTAGHENYSTSSLLESSSANTSLNAEENNVLGTTVSNWVFGVGTWTDTSTSNPDSMVRAGIQSTDRLNLAGFNIELTQNDMCSYGTTTHSTTWVETFTPVGLQFLTPTYDSTTHDNDVPEDLHISVEEANTYHSTTHDNDTSARQYDSEEENNAFGTTIYGGDHHYDTTFAGDIYQSHSINPFEGQPTGHPPLTTPLQVATEDNEHQLNKWAHETSNQEMPIMEKMLKDSWTCCK